MEEEAPQSAKNNKKKRLIIPLVTVAIITMGVGGFFAVRSLGDKKVDEGVRVNTVAPAIRKKKKKDDDEVVVYDDTTSMKDDNNVVDDGASNRTDSSKPTPNADNGTNSNSSNQIDAEISYAETRENDYYIEARTNEVVIGSCDVSLIPADGGEGYYTTVPLEEKDGISVCGKSFPLKSTTSGDYFVLVTVSAADGRSRKLDRMVSF